MKKLVILLLIGLLHLGLVRSYLAEGPAGALTWLSDPLNYLIATLLIGMFRFQRRISLAIDRLLWDQRANLAGAVPLMGGMPSGDVRTGDQSRHRSRTWTIIAVWAAALLLIAAYLRLGGGFYPTLALSCLVGLYWISSNWRIYTFLSATTVLACAAPVLLWGGTDGAALMVYAAIALYLDRTRRSLAIALGIAVISEGFRHEVGAETSLFVAAIGLSRRRILQIGHVFYSHGLSNWQSKISPRLPSSWRQKPAGKEEQAI